MDKAVSSGMIDSAEQLLERLREKEVLLSPLEEAYIRETDKKYRLRISEYYFNLIDWDDPECPIRMQCIPDGAELEDISGYSEDPLHEKDYEAVPFLIHKYRSRAAFMCSNFCYMHCRHCTRKNTVMNEEICTKDALPAALEYIKEHTEINDILITGGDPLSLPLETLEYYIAGFRSVPSVNTIRIGTRVLAADPGQITDELCDMLEKYHPLWLFTQFNHPKEVTKEAAEAANRLLRRGIPLGNQSVLLKGINDDADTLVELYTKLIGIRVRPYYLYLCDRVLGTAHFATDYTVGVELIEALRYRLPGYAVPKFIIDADGKHGGKVTIERNHVLKETSDYLLLQGDSEDSVTKFYR
ncbi:MAG: KamA family radical SAM protein [Lachnospiraceae bacterium]|nr:KamA family radical SAM protein [Lachnospiraceae bacterium]